MATATAGRTQLSRWVKANASSRRKLAAQLGADHAQISRLLSGARLPGLDLAVRIERATGVPCSAWVTR